MTRSFWSRRWNCPLFGFLAKGLAVNLPVEPDESSENVDVDMGIVRLVGYKPERELFSFLMRAKKMLTSCFFWDREITRSPSSQFQRFQLRR